jgi:hypothetical protein
LASLRQEAREKRKAAPDARKQQVKARYQKRIGVAERRVERTRGMLQRARLSRDKIKAQYSIASKKRTWNLGTSLKSYIDPRVYYEWGQQVDYDVLEKYYPKALRRKFAWVKGQTTGDAQAAHSEGRRKRKKAGRRGDRRGYSTAWALGLGRTTPWRRTGLTSR